MTRAILLVTRWIGLAHDRWRARVAGRRYACERSHEGLRLRTPHEVFYRRRPRRPRGIDSGVLVVRRLGGDARLSVFRLQAA